MKDHDEQLIEEQIRYYARRAPEYDATTVGPSGPLGGQTSIFRGALEEFAPRGRVLEIAAGTGEWTKRLVDYADEVVALDASAEMLELNERKLSSPKVAYAVGDVFKWRPDAPFDVVFFANWLSHVPMSRFERFWEIVASHLRADGRVFFVDQTRPGRYPERSDGPDVVVRRLEDGSVHRAIKIFWEPEDLQSRLEGLGWAMRVDSTDDFLCGRGRRTNS